MAAVRGQGKVSFQVLSSKLGIGRRECGFVSARNALADAALVRPLPFPEPHRLVALAELFQGQPVRPVNPVDFVDWSERTRSFTAIAAVVRGGGSIVGDDGVAEPVPGQAVTARFFDVLGVTPIAGRTFRDDDEGPAPDVVVLSEGFWRRRFGADPTLVGRSITIAGRLQTVIGIVPDNFRVVPASISNDVSEPPRLWTVFNYGRGSYPSQRGALYMYEVGRIRARVSDEAAKEKYEEARRRLLGLGTDEE
jgi:putative ABC transport system permease protein